MGKIIDDIIKSFNTDKGGFSSRKLSAFIAVMIAIYFTIAYGVEKFLVEVIIVWLTFALLCLGIVTIDQIIRLKNGNSTSSSSTTVTTEQQVKTEQKPEVI